VSVNQKEKISIHRRISQMQKTIPHKDASEIKCYKRGTRGMAGLKVSYCVYKVNARRDNRVFELSFDDYVDIVKKRCFYCNKKPSTKVYSRCKSTSYATRMWGMSCVNGIDRIDSKMGYLKKNVRPCCTECNFLKQDRSEREFRNIIKAIYKHWILNEVK